MSQIVFPEALINATRHWTPSVFDLILGETVFPPGTTFNPPGNRSELALTLRDHFLNHIPDLIKEQKPSVLARALADYHRSHSPASHPFVEDSSSSEPTYTNESELLTESVSSEAPKQKSSLTAYFQKQPKIKVTDEERRRMASQCPECCAEIDQGLCKYPLCTHLTCQKDCDRIGTSRVSARVHNKKSDFGTTRRRLIDQRLNDFCNQEPKCKGCARVWANP